jgi:hypothetical protein
MQKNAAEKNGEREMERITPEEEARDWELLRRLEAEIGEPISVALAPPINPSDIVAVHCVPNPSYLEGDARTRQDAACVLP